MHLILSNPLLAATAGGGLIGLSAAILLVLNGRVTGLSGIIADGVLRFRTIEKWRWAYLLGLNSGGIVLLFWLPQSFQDSLETPTPVLILGGLFVGFGTRLSGGCTSGHGVCGVSRLSKRSIFATLTFVIIGILSATLFGKLGLY